MKPVVTCYVLRDHPASQRYVGAVGRLHREQGARAVWRTVIAQGKSPLLLEKHIHALPAITVEVGGREVARITGARPYHRLAQALATLPPTTCR